jgi:antitoxin component HigA of HigAB toxin-antitoxin module
MPHPVTAKVATALRVELARRNVPQGDAAQHIGKSKQALSRKMTGRVPFTVDEVVALANVYGLDVAEVLTDAA